MQHCLLQHQIRLTFWEGRAAVQTRICFYRAWFSPFIHYSERAQFTSHCGVVTGGYSVVNKLSCLGPGSVGDGPITIQHLQIPFLYAWLLGQSSSAFLSHGPFSIFLSSSSDILTTKLWTSLLKTDMYITEWKSLTFKVNTSCHFLYSRGYLSSRDWWKHWLPLEMWQHLTAYFHVYNFRAIQDCGSFCVWSVLCSAIYPSSPNILLRIYFLLSPFTFFFTAFQHTPSDPSCPPYFCIHPLALRVGFWSGNKFAEMM